MGEDAAFTPGSRLCRFSLDGVACGVIICYDLRFPELSRSLALQDMEMLFVVAQWPDVRISHLQTLSAARAIENQVYLVCCNSCGKAGDTQYGGRSAIYDPLGNSLAQAGKNEALLTAELPIPAPKTLMDVFADRRPELYRM
jgi:predicted amidohydrolase